MTLLLPEETSPDLIAAWPPLSQAARMIGVAPSSLSRRADLDRQRRGREARLRPAEVLRLAQYYRHRPVGEVAHELLDFAYRQAPDQAGLIEAEIALILGTEMVALARERFLTEARHTALRALRRNRAELAGPRSAAKESSMSRSYFWPFERSAFERPVLHVGPFRRDSQSAAINPDLELESADD